MTKKEENAAPLEPVESEPLTLKVPPAPEEKKADTAVSPTKASAPREEAPVRCYVLQAFAHNDQTYQPGEWLDLPADWAKHHIKAGHVTDYAGYLARTK
jgi:hypothetical protein